MKPTIYIPSRLTKLLIPPTQLSPVGCSAA